MVMDDQVFSLESSQASLENGHKLGSSHGDVDYLTVRRRSEVTDEMDPQEQRVKSRLSRISDVGAWVSEEYWTIIP